MADSFTFPGIGTVVNVLAIIAGGLLGSFFGRFLGDRQQDALAKASGVCVLFLGISGALEEMVRVEGDRIAGGHSMLLILSLVLGTLIGEFLDIERHLEEFGEWLKIKSGNAKDNLFIEGFLTASLTVCVGAMAIVGSIQDGILGDPSTLIAKAVLDFIIIIAMTGSLGKGCAFSAVPVAILQGSVTLLSRLISPLMTDQALANLSMVGSVMIFCVGVNLVWGRKIRVANMLPGLVIAAAFAFTPWAL